MTTSFGYMDTHLPWVFESPKLGMNRSPYFYQQKRHESKTRSAVAAFLSSDTFHCRAERFLCVKSFVHVTTRRKFVSVCNLFLGTCLHNACLQCCMYMTCSHEFIWTTAPLRGSRLACIHKGSNVDPGLPQ